VDEPPPGADYLPAPCKSLQHQIDNKFKDADLVFSGTTTGVTASGVFRTRYNLASGHSTLYKSKIRFPKLKNEEIMNYSLFKNYSVDIEHVYKGAELLEGKTHIVIGRADPCAPCKKYVAKIGPITPSESVIFVIRKNRNTDEMVGFINYGLAPRSKADMIVEPCFQFKRNDVTIEMMESLETAQ